MRDYNPFENESMTTAQKQSAIHRINDRYHQIVEQFGAGSRPAEDYHAAMMALGGPDGMTSTGRLKRGKSVVDKMREGDIDALLSKPTAGQIKERLKRNYAEDNDIDEDEVTDDQIQEELDIEQETLDLMDELGAALSDAIHKWRTAHKRNTGKMTYDELAEACREYQQSTSEEKARMKKATYMRHYRANKKFAAVKIEKAKGFKAQA